MEANEVIFSIFLDGNKRILADGEKVKFRYYEEEAIRCVSSIRRNAGQYRDCKIIAGYSRDSGIRESTFSVLRKFGVVLVEIESEIESGRWSPSWFGKDSFMFSGPLAFQVWCEEMNWSSMRRIVYLDLDVTILSAMPDIVMNGYGDRAVTLFAYGEEKARHDTDLLERWRNLEKAGIPCFNTYIVVNNPKSRFFRDMDSLIKADMDGLKRFYRDVECGGNERNGHYFEESIYDFLYASSSSRGMVNVLKCEDYEGRFFRHRHMDEKELVPLYMSIQNMK